MASRTAPEPPPAHLAGLVPLRGLQPPADGAERPRRRAVTTHSLRDLNGIFARQEPASGGGKRIRVCVVDTVLQTGGAEWFATQLCLLANPGIFDVVVVSWDSRGSGLAERLRSAGLTVIDSTSWSTSGLDYDHWKSVVLFDLLERLSPDLLFFSSQYLFGELDQERLARFTAVVRISNFHAGELERTDFSAAALVICTTEEQLRAVSRRFGDRATLISTGVDTDAFRSPGGDARAGLKREAGLDGKTVVLFVARLGDPLKRTPVFQDVVRRVRARRPDIAFVVVGYFERHNEDTAPQFRAFAEEQEVVWKEGVRPWEMPAVYAMADVLISTSAPHEGLSNTVLQALSAGVVPVVTGSAGMDELVEPGETGFLVADGTAESLAEAVVAAADLDEAARARMTAAGRKRVEERYSLARSAVAYQRELVALHRRGPVTVHITDGRFGIGGAEWLAALLALNADPAEIRFELVVHEAKTDLVRWVGERGMVAHAAPPGTNYSGWIEGSMEDTFRRLRPDVVMPCTITTWPRHEPFYRLLAISQNASDAAVLVPEQYDQADWILCVSEDVKAHLSAAHQWKMTVLHNSIDVEMFKPDAEAQSRVRARLGIPAGARVVLWCGRLHEARKRPDVLQEVVAAMAGDPGVHFLVVGYFRGDEGDQEGWRRFVEAHPAVTWVADVNPWEAPEHYAAADAYLSTSGFKQSDFEGLSVATVQALATALPVVSTRSGGQEEVVEDGGNGRLVDTGDVPGLVAALRDVLGGDPEAFEAMRRRSREKALEDFDIRRHARTYTRVARLLRDNVGAALAVDPELAPAGGDLDATAASFVQYTWPLLRAAADGPSPARRLDDEGSAGALAAALERVAAELAPGERVAVPDVGPDYAAAEAGPLSGERIHGVLAHLDEWFAHWRSAERAGPDLILQRR